MQLNIKFCLRKEHWQFCLRSTLKSSLNKTFTHSISNNIQLRRVTSRKSSKVKRSWWSWFVLDFSCHMNPASTEIHILQCFAKRPMLAAKQGLDRPISKDEIQLDKMASWNKPWPHAPPLTAISTFCQPPILHCDKGPFIQKYVLSFTEHSGQCDMTFC